jgi:hypothetical protein
MLADLTLKITPKMLHRETRRKALYWDDRPAPPGPQRNYSFAPAGSPGQYDPFLKGDTILKSMISKEEAPHVGKEAQSLDKRKVAVPSGTRL